LDELVPEDDRYRRIDALVGDWGFVREAARPYYADGLGRPSIDSGIAPKPIAPTLIPVLPISRRIHSHCPAL